MNKNVETLTNPSLEIVELEGKKYISLKSDCLIFCSLSSKQYNVFFMPTSKEDFENATCLKFEENKLYPFIEIEDRDGYEYLVEVSKDEFHDLALVCTGKELLEISDSKDFKDILIDNLKLDIENYKKYIENSNKDCELLFRDLINQTQKAIDFISSNL